MSSQITVSLDKQIENNAKTSKKEAYYFSHDANARNDIKIMGLRRKLGWEAYGLYWALIEILREQPEYKLTINSIEDIAYELHSNGEVISALVNDYSLFEVEGEFFYSARLSRSMEMYNAMRTKRKESGKKGGYSKALAMLQQRSGSATALTEQFSTIKVNEIKVNETKVNDSKRKTGFDKPTIPEVVDEFSKKNLDDFTAMGEAKKFFDHYECNGWMAGKVKMQNWRAAVSKWVSGMKNSNYGKNTKPIITDSARPGARRAAL